MPRKYNYLITGGLGFIGSNIAKLIIKKKNLAKCILVDNYSGYINPLGRSFSDFRLVFFTGPSPSRISARIAVGAV